MSWSEGKEGSHLTSFTSSSSFSRGRGGGSGDYLAGMVVMCGFLAGGLARSCEDRGGQGQEGDEEDSGKVGVHLDLCLGWKN